MTEMDYNTEQQLTGALHRVVALVNANQVTPTDALVKVARETLLLPEQIRRVGEWYNTSRSLANQQKQAGHNRCSNFSLVNPDEVIKQVAATKTAAQKYVQSRIDAVVHETAQVPDLFQKQAAQAKREQVAEKTAAYFTPELPKPEDQTPTFSSRWEAARETQVAVKQATAELDLAEAEMEAQLRNVVSSVRQALPQVPFGELEQGIINRYGDDVGVKLANVIYTLIEGQGLKQKRAADFGVRRIFDYTLNPYATIDRFVQAALNADHAAQKVASAVQGVQTAKLPFSGQLPWNKTASAMGTVLGWQPGHSDDGGQLIRDKDREFNRALDAAVANPMRQQVKAVRLQALLPELLKDPVIGRYDQDEIIERINELAEIAPNAGDKPMFLRGALRRALQQGNVDPFEVGQYAAISKDQKNNEQADTALLEAVQRTADVTRANSQAERDVAHRFKTQENARANSLQKATLEKQKTDTELAKAKDFREAEAHDWAHLQDQLGKILAAKQEARDVEAHGWAGARHTQDTDIATKKEERDSQAHRWAHLLAAKQEARDIEAHSWAGARHTQDTDIATKKEERDSQAHRWAEARHTQDTDIATKKEIRDAEAHTANLENTKKDTELKGLQIADFTGVAPTPGTTPSPVTPAVVSTPLPP